MFKIKVLAGQCPLQRLSGRTLPRLPQPLAAAGVPRLVGASPQPLAPSSCSLFSAVFFPLLSLLRTPVIALRDPLENQDDLTWRSFITSTKAFVPGKVTFAASVWVETFLEGSPFDPAQGLMLR